jgi:hypothetical protein
MALERSTSDEIHTRLHALDGVAHHVELDELVLAVATEPRNARCSSVVHGEWYPKWLYRQLSVAVLGGRLSLDNPRGQQRECDEGAPLPGASGPPWVAIGIKPRRQPIALPSKTEVSQRC